MDSRGHAVQLFLAPEIRSALVQFMAKHDLDKEFAAQILLLKSLKSDGFINDAVYEKYYYRYSRKITPENRLSLSDLQERQKLDEKTRYFQAILASEWQMHPSLEWRHKVLAIAELWKDKIPAAKLILDLGAAGKK